MLGRCHYVQVQAPRQMAYEPPADQYYGFVHFKRPMELSMDTSQDPCRKCLYGLHWMDVLRTLKTPLSP